MVILLDEPNSFGSQIGRALGQGIASGGAALAGNMQMKKEDKLLKDRYGIDVSGFRGETRRAILGEELKRGAMKKLAEATFPGNQQSSGNGGYDEGINDEFMMKPSLGNQSSPQATLSKSRRILDDQEIEAEGLRIARDRTSRGVPTTYEEGIELAERSNDRNIRDRDIQNKYAQIAENELSKVLPNASSELQKVFAKKGDEYRRQGITDPEISRKLATDAKNLKHQMSTLEKSIGPKRILSDIKNTFTGEGLNQEKAKNSIRAQLMPLKEELGPAYIDVSRNILANTGRQPEEVEELVSNLGEGTQKELANFEKIPINMENVLLGGSLGKKSGLGTTPALNKEEMQKFESNLKKVLKEDPAANLVLLRREYEKKGVDWRSFKDILDQMILNKEYTPNKDQRMDVLDNPPLTYLDQILYKFKLTGR